ncbi:ATP-binding protein [Saccharopolyspora shandongensis]|uniref:ATP-binding protein n=1 Tax=Saccharopolyspora shandongensis TaxID=418495 RepID=UPI0033F2991C
MPWHYLALDGAATLPTLPFQMVYGDVSDLVKHQALGVVHGAAGLGKSFAVAAALENLRDDPAKPANLTVVDVVFSHAPTTLQVAQGLARALLRIPTPRSKNRFKLQEEMLEQLACRPHLLVVDEAQRLTRHAMEVLRFLYDYEDIRLSLLLVGGDGCWETISREPMLVSRMLRRRHFKPLPAAQVPRLMRAYHPLYAQAEEQLLAEVDASFAHGNWRSWVCFTATAVDLAEAAERDTLDAELVANSYTKLGYDDPDL